jgi:hypothetical protein
MSNFKTMGVDVCKEVALGIYGIVIALPDGKFAVAIPLENSYRVASGFGDSEDEATEAAIASRLSILREGGDFSRDEIIEAAWEGEVHSC